MGKGVKKEGKNLSGYAIIDKRRGETPLEALESWRAGKSDLAHSPVSYAGRLDPMAEGKLLVLFGEECRKQTHYTKLDKEYEIEVLLDMASDTGDVLGLGSYAGIVTKPREKDVRQAVRKEQGMHMRRYPAFSSKTVNGKPLFLYTLEGTLHEIEIPTHSERVYRIKLLDLREMQTDTLRAHMQDLLARVSRAPQPSKVLGADFRQDAIRARWNEIFEKAGERNFFILRLRVTCASGTYMRTLAERLGASLGTSALALSITRTHIGKYQRLPFSGFWKKSY